MEQTTCRHCRFFRQHYIKRGWRYEETNLGHCATKLRKKHRPSELACPLFQQSESTTPK